MGKRIRRLFIADYLITPDRIIDHGGVLCENDKILAVGNLSSFSMDEELELHEFDNGYITPGFIDTHIHGAGGFDCSSVERSINPMDAMSQMLCERGVTAFVPTVVADEPETMLRNLELLAELIDMKHPGATPCGISVEGPFINPRKRGAQLESVLREIDLGYAAELIAAGRGKIKMMTFAPELPRAMELIEFLLASDVTPSMGHSEANEEETLRAIEAGACHATHLFNGMPPLHQRNMSLTSVLLTDSRVSAEMIIDGRHIHPRMVDLACRCKKANQIIGISDCTMAAGMPNGEYWIGPTPIRVENGFSQTRQSVLAGTTTMLDTGWHSLMASGHLSETQAASAVTRNAALVMKLSDRGVLLPKLFADLAVFEKGSNRPLMTVRQGEIVFDGRNAAR